MSPTFKQRVQCRKRHNFREENLTFRRGNMTEQETVKPELDETMKEALQEDIYEDNLPQEAPEAEAKEETRVPLSALQKERKKRQEVEHEKIRFEAENRVLREQQQRIANPEPKDDETQYESATRKDVDTRLSQTKEEILREVQETLWVRQNQEKFSYARENLENFLKQRPNLRDAIATAPNRWEEAYILMEALTPKQQAQLKPTASAAKKETPGSPSGVPKAAAINQAVDVMTMSDKEFTEWRNMQKRRRTG